MYFFFKRAFDLVTSTVALLILLPVMIPIAIFLLCTGEHYVFYRQSRIGQGNRTFKIIKFATMLKNSPNMGTGMITLRNDPRLLPLGKFLRITKINEIPQILNVIKGDMSLVGPRPLVDKVFNFYSTEAKQIISSVKPGITGVGSIVFRDEEKLISSAVENKEIFYRQNISPYKAALEEWYVTNKSFIVDIKIIFLTLWVIFFPKTNIINKVLKGLPQKK